MAVLNPFADHHQLPRTETELFDVENNPNKPEEGTRPGELLPVVYIEREDFWNHLPIRGCSARRGAAKGVYLIPLHRLQGRGRQRIGGSVRQYDQKPGRLNPTEAAR